MTLSSNLDSPISNLDCDILWNIFCINSSSSDTPKNEGDPSPLTTTRKSSQVCAFWREIILGSPSIWGNCIDLDMLGQDGGEWREEVLRRTGNALLSVWANHKITLNTTRHALLVALIRNHWARIQVFNVVVECALIFHDVSVWNAFGCPARHLRVFSLRSDSRQRPNAQSPIILPANFRLFSDDAPVLTEFSLFSREETLIPLPIQLLPPIFPTTLRHLHLCQPTELSAVDLLTACMQMPCLEVLGLTIARIIPPSNTTTPSLHRVNLPRLRKLEVESESLDIFSGFIGHLIAHSACALDIKAWLNLNDIQPSKADIEEMQHALSHYANGFFDHHRDGPNYVQELQLTIIPSCIGITTPRSRFQFQITGLEIIDGDAQLLEIPFAILGPLINVISSLKFPNTIIRMTLIVFNDESDIQLTPNDHQYLLSPLLQSVLRLESIEEILTSIESLVYLLNLLGSEPCALFPSLKELRLSCFSPTDAQHCLEAFFACRKDTAPLQTLNLIEHDIEWSLGDLRFLDGFTGLRVKWTRKNEDIEYICGSGNPDMLLIT